MGGGSDVKMWECENVEEGWGLVECVGRGVFGGGCWGGGGLCVGWRVLGASVGLMRVVWRSSSGWGGCFGALSRGLWRGGGRGFGV